MHGGLLPSKQSEKMNLSNSLSAPGFMASAINAVPQIERMADMLANSQLLPAHYRNKADAFALCLKAMAEGKTPFEVASAPQPASLSLQDDEERSQVVIEALLNAQNGEQLAAAEQMMDNSVFPDRIGNMLLAVRQKQFKRLVGSN